MIMKTYARIIVLLIVLSSFAFAMSAQSDTFGEVTVSRIYPESAYIGQKIWITIAIENTGTTDKTIMITDKLGDADFNKSGTTSVNTTYGTMYLFEWEISLPAGENTSVSYWIEPKSSGNYVISPSEVVIGGTKYRMKSAAIAVSCLIDAKCDAASSENFLNCPQDCSSGSADGVCDAVADSKCDPDCASGADSDCLTQPTNITQPTNLTEPIKNQTAIEKNETENKETGTTGSSEKGFDLGANAVYIVGIAVIAVAIVFWMKKK